MSKKSSIVERLLDVAIEHFGQHGLNGTSTRDIARDAGTLMSAITYHFGSKEGLYLAAADRIAERLGMLMFPAVERSEALCGSDGDAKQARAALHVLVHRAVEIMAGAESAPLARFVTREQADPGEAFQRIYSGSTEGMLSRFTDLLRRAAGRPLTDEEGRLRAMAIIGQVMVFRTARASLLRSLAWSHIGAREVDAIHAVVADHLDAILDRLSLD
jgi:AcrR family transcriptional regulator